MSRRPVIAAARQLQPGALRADGPGSTLSCLLLASGREWVAVDTETGAYLRPHVAFGSPPEDGAATAGGAGGGAAGAGGGAAGRQGPAAGAGDGAAGRLREAVPFELLQLTLAVDDEPPDPARPEAVEVGEVRVLPAPRRRAVHRLLGHLVTRSPKLPLLGTLGPSIAYSDLDGGRPSVVLVSPDKRPRFGNGPVGPYCQFSLGGRRHSLPLYGRPEQMLSPERPGGAGAGAASPNLLLVGYAAPRRGQVPKVVLGALSDRPS